MARISFFINTPVLRGDPAEQLKECVEILKNEGMKQVNAGELSPEELMDKIKEIKDEH